MWRRYLYFFFVPMLLCSFTEAAWSKDCRKTDYHFTYSAQLSNLYQEGCDRIRGNVSVGKEVRSLHLLSNLRSIGGDLSVNLQVTNISGLEGVETIGGDLRINAVGSWCDSYGCIVSPPRSSDSLLEFRGLNMIGGDLVIEGDVLTSTRGMYQLNIVKGTIAVYEYGGDIRAPPTLIELYFRSLNTLGGLQFRAPGSVYGDRSTINLPGLSRISGDVRIEDSDLNSLGLESLQLITGDLIISNTGGPFNLDALANLRTVQGDLTIVNNGLTECSAIAPLLGWPNGPPNDRVGGRIKIENNRVSTYSSCEDLADVLYYYEPPPPPSVPTNVRARLLSAEQEGIILEVRADGISVSDGDPRLTRIDAACTDGINTYTGTRNIIDPIFRSGWPRVTVSGLVISVTYTCTVTATSSVGTSSPSAATEPILYGFEALFKIKNFVDKFYRVVLDRDPDQVGFDNWVAALTRRTLTGSDLARGFFLSPEYTGKSKSDSAFLDDVYLAYFSRTADAGGKQGWLDLLAQGGSRTQVLDGFSGSQEFIALAESYGIQPFAGYVCVSNAWKPVCDYSSGRSDTYRTPVSTLAESDVMRPVASRLATQESTVPKTKMEPREGAEAKPIPTLSVLNLGILTILLSLFGLLRFRSKTL